MFIKNIAQIAKPLYDMLEKDKKFIWSTTEQQDFDAIKMGLSKSTELAMPDFGKPFTLKTDASDIGIGVVFKQNNLRLYTYQGLLENTKSYME